MPAYIHQDEIVVRREHSDYVRGYLSQMGFASAYGAPNASGRVRSFADGYLPGGDAIIPLPVPVAGGSDTPGDSKKIIELQQKQIDRLEEVVDTLLIIASKDSNVSVSVDADGIVTRSVNTVKERLKRNAL